MNASLLPCNDCSRALRKVMNTPDMGPLSATYVSIGQSHDPLYSSAGISLVIQPSNPGIPAQSKDAKP
eukprot:3866577-Pyramimonas_sp.AAC.1